MVALLLGLQLGYTKYMCFLCLWDSRDNKNYWTKNDWKERTEHVPGRYNVKHVALVDPAKIFLPPLDIKLDLMKNFVQAMDRNGRGFLYLEDKFGNTLSEAKIKAGVFVGPQIREVMKDETFLTTLNPKELVYGSVSISNVHKMPLITWRYLTTSVFIVPIYLSMLSNL